MMSFELTNAPEAIMELINGVFRTLIHLQLSSSMTFWFTAGLTKAMSDTYESYFKG